jgi:hypothetical protein
MSINIDAYRRAKMLAKKVSLDNDTIAQIAKYLEQYVNSLPPELQNVAIARFNGKVYTRKDLPVLFLKDPEIQKTWLEKLRL